MWNQKKVIVKNQKRFHTERKGFYKGKLFWTLVLLKGYVAGRVVHCILDDGLKLPTAIV